MINLIIRTIFIYFILIFAVRVMGKKQAGQLQPYELVITLIISEVASTPMDNPGTPIFYGIVPALTLLLLYFSIAFLTRKSKYLRNILCGKPSILVHNGKIDLDEIKKQNYCINDLIEQMRLLGYTNIAEINYAILETNGQLSILPYNKFNALTPNALNLEVLEDGICVALIIEGEKSKMGLKHMKIDDKKLKKLLHTLGYSSHNQIAIFTLSSSGEAFIEDMEGKIKHINIPKEYFKEEAL